MADPQRCAACGEADVAFSCDIAIRSISIWKAKHSDRRVRNVDSVSKPVTLGLCKACLDRQCLERLTELRRYGALVPFGYVLLGVVAVGASLGLLSMLGLRGWCLFAGVLAMPPAVLGLRAVAQGLAMIPGGFLWSRDASKKLEQTRASGHLQADQDDRERAVAAAVQTKIDEHDQFVRLYLPKEFMSCPAWVAAAGSPHGFEECKERSHYDVVPWRDMEEAQKQATAVVHRMQKKMQSRLGGFVSSDGVGGLSREFNTLQRMGPQARAAVPYVASLVKAHNEFTALTACQTLGDMRSTSAVPALLQALNDERVNLREYAVWALERIADGRPGDGSEEAWRAWWERKRASGGNG